MKSIFNTTGAVRFTGFVTWSSVGKVGTASAQHMLWPLSSRDAKNQSAEWGIITSVACGNNRIEPQKSAVSLGSTKVRRRRSVLCEEQEDDPCEPRDCRHKFSWEENLILKVHHGKNIMGHPRKNVKTLSGVIRVSRTHVVKNATSTFSNVVWFCGRFCKWVCKTIFTSNATRVVQMAGVTFVSQHLCSMMGLLLFRHMWQSVKTVWLLVVAGVVVCFLGRLIAVFGLDNDTSSLATLVSVVAIRSIRHAKDALRTLQRPKSAINVLNLNGRNNLVNFFHISDSRTSGVHYKHTRACNFSSLVWHLGSAPTASASLLFDSQNHWKRTISPLSDLFAHLHLLSPDFLSSALLSIYCRMFDF